MRISKKWSCSKKEGEDRLAVPRVIGELLPVALVLFQTPLGHLIETGGKEHVATEDLGLDAERNPGACLPEVVGAADLVEAPAVGNFTLSGAWAAKVLQDQVGLEVEELEEIIINNTTLKSCIG